MRHPTERGAGTGKNWHHATPPAPCGGPARAALVGQSSPMSADTFSPTLQVALLLTLVAVVVGLISAIVDNVPLVAAGIGMYDFPSGHGFWLELAYCAGTGGSCLIIGSAAGVAAMGLENIDFVWYLKRIAPVALAGYLAGIGVYELI